jgi:sugar phosphate isomerase/epimerase
MASLSTSTTTRPINLRLRISLKSICPTQLETDGTNAPIGPGEIDFAEVAATLEAIGYGGASTMQVISSTPNDDFRGVANCSVSLALNRRRTAS